MLRGMLRDDWNNKRQEIITVDDYHCGGDTEVLEGRKRSFQRMFPLCSLDYLVCAYAIPFAPPFLPHCLPSISLSRAGI